MQVPPLNSPWLTIPAGLVLLLVAPFAVATAYLCATRLGQFESDIWDYLALAICVAAGLAGLWILPLGRVWRAALTLPYVIVLTPLTFFYAFVFVCAAFGDCL